MELLVTGLRKRGSGKTAVARGLSSYLDAEAFKPFAGNHLWRNWTDISRGLPERLYGSDARLLAGAAGMDVYDVNPVHRVWFPRSHNRGGGDVFGLDRVWDGEQSLFVNASLDLVGPFEEFEERCSRVVEVEGTGPEAETRLSATRRGYELLGGDVVVESYTDVALPFPGLSPDVVLGVEPFRLHVFEPDGFLNAWEFLRGRYSDRGSWEVGMEDVLEVMDPGLSLGLPPVNASDLEKVVEGYGPIFEQLL